MHLANIPDMRRRFGVDVGLSDHSVGSIAAVVAVSMGACVIEKHVKLEGIDSADSEFSMAMEDFAAMVEDVRNARRIAGTVQYGPTNKERENLRFRRSLFVVKDLCAGETITEENVRSIRPSGGLKPKFLSEVLGMRAKRDLLFGMPLKMEDLEEGQR